MRGRKRQGNPDFGSSERPLGPGDGGVDLKELCNLRGSWKNDKKWRDILDRKNIFYIKLRNRKADGA